MVRLVLLEVAMLVVLFAVCVGASVNVMVVKHNPRGRLVGAGQKTGSVSSACVAVEVGHMKVDPFEKHSRVGVVVNERGGILVWMVKTGSLEEDVAI